MIPHHEARVVVARLLHNLFHHVRRAYLPEITFPRAVTGTIIAAEIVLAEANGEPATDSDLARTLEVPRTTLLPRLGMFAEKQFIRRGRHVWHLGQLQESETGNQSIYEASRMIIAAGDALRRAGYGSVASLIFWDDSVILALL